MRQAARERDECVTWLDVLHLAGRRQMPWAGLQGERSHSLRERKRQPRERKRQYEGEERPLTDRAGAGHNTHTREAHTIHRRRTNRTHAPHTYAPQGFIVYEEHTWYCGGAILSRMPGDLAATLLTSHTDSW